MYLRFCKHFRFRKISNKYPKNVNIEGRRKKRYNLNNLLAGKPENILSLFKQNVEVLYHNFQGHQKKLDQIISDFFEIYRILTERLTTNPILDLS